MTGSRIRHSFQLASGHVVQVVRAPEAMGFDFVAKRWFYANWEITIWFPFTPGVNVDGSIRGRLGESFDGETPREAMAKVREVYERKGHWLSWTGVTFTDDGALILPEQRGAASLPRAVPPVLEMASRAPPVRNWVHPLAEENPR